VDWPPAQESRRNSSTYESATSAGVSINDVRLGPFAETRNATRLRLPVLATFAIRARSPGGHLHHAALW
jgi:hypothetical protein